MLIRIMRVSFVLAFVLVAGQVVAGAEEAWRKQAILHLDESSSAELRGVPVSAVQMGPGFWAERRRVVSEVSIPTLHEEFEQRGIFDNFRRLAGKQTARRGPRYTDSDVYKWMEAVAFEVQSGNSRNRALLEQVIDLVLAAQEESGYLNTHYTLERRNERHTDMLHGHELYCLGHLIQAGVAWYRATGQRNLLDGSLRFVRYLQDRFGPGKEAIFDGHPEIELALIELYRITRDKSLLEFAQYLLEGDPRIGGRLSRRDIVYTFVGKPFVERTQMEGHAVRAGYAASGAADYYLETGDRTYFDTLQRLWIDLSSSKVYITGGIGSRQTGEAFGERFELPNQLAYTESCAAIANFFWNWRMLSATGEAQYADMMERALYNGINSGLSLDGRLYCYRNPLELSGDPGDRIRNSWYDTTCCPPNLQRVLASLPGYLFGISKQGVAVHLYHNATLEWTLPDGTALRLRQETDYPSGGVVRFAVDPAHSVEMELALRVPEWSNRTEILVNGQKQAGIEAGGYHRIQRKWQPGDVVELRLDMSVRHTLANPRVRDNVAKVAVERGPLVYCLEGLDQTRGLALESVALDLRPGSRTAVAIEGAEPGSVPTLRHRGVRMADPAHTLYRTRQSRRNWRPADLKLIPYFAFANREPTAMMVWIPYIE